MPAGEEMFKYHGYSGPCPKLPPKQPQGVDMDVEIKLGPYGEQKIKIQIASAANPPVLQELIVMNLDGRPVILTAVADMGGDLGMPEGKCGDCQADAVYRVLEMWGDRWLWCGGCHLGG